MLLGVLIVLGLWFALDGYRLVNAPDALGVILFTVIGWNVLLFIVTILVIIDSVTMIRKSNTSVLATSVFVVKLAGIPFFLMIGLLLVLLLFGGMLILAVGGVALIAAGWIGLVLTYLALLPTSVYGWASVIQLRRDRIIETPLVVLYSILLAVPVADVVVGILLFVHYRRGSTAIAAQPHASIEPAGSSTSLISAQRR